MGQVIEAELDDQGRMVFAADAVEPLGLTPGATLVVEAVDDGHVRLCIEAPQMGLVNKGGRLVFRGEPLCDLQEFVNQEHDRRVEELVKQAGY